MKLVLSYDADVIQPVLITQGCYGNLKMMEKAPGKFDESDVEKITPEKLAKMFVAFYEFQKATADPDLFHRELEHYMNVYNRGRNGYIFAGKGSNHKCEKSIIEVVEKIENPTIKEDFYHAGAKALYNFARIGEPKFQQPDPEFDLEKRYDKQSIHDQ